MTQCLQELCLNFFQWDTFGSGRLHHSLQLLPNHPDHLVSAQLDNPILAGLGHIYRVRDGFKELDELGQSEAANSTLPAEVLVIRRDELVEADGEVRGVTEQLNNFLENRRIKMLTSLN